MSDLITKKAYWIPELSQFTEEIGMNSCHMSITSKAKDKLPHTILNIDGSGKGVDYKSAINKKPKSKDLAEYIKPKTSMSDSTLAEDFISDLKLGITGGAFFKGDSISFANGRKYAELFVDRLVNGNGETWFDDGTLSKGMQYTPEVKSFIQKICSDLRSAMKSQFGYFWDIKLSNKYYTENHKLSFSFESSPTLKGLVGGTQTRIVTIENMVYRPHNRTWKADLNLHIEDVFGVEESDVTKPRGASARVAKSALANFWILQHQRGKKPFITVFDIPFACQGNY